MLADFFLPLCSEDLLFSSFWPYFCIVMFGMVRVWPYINTIEVQNNGLTEGFQLQVISSRSVQFCLLSPFLFAWDASPPH